MPAHPAPSPRAAMQISGYRNFNRKGRGGGAKDAKEIDYETCLAYELSERGLFVETQKALPLTYKGLVMERGYRLDMLVNELVVVELKSVETITDVHRAQVLSYLKLGPYRLGFLINFNTSRIKNGIQRFVNGLDDR